MGPEAVHEECFGWIPPQGIPQADWGSSADRTVQSLAFNSSGGCDGRNGLVGGEELLLPPLEQSQKVNCNKADYIHVSSGEIKAEGQG